MLSITVTSPDDDGPGTLRAALAAASPGDTIEFSLTAPNNVIYLQSPLGPITKNNITIDGGGNVTLDGSEINTSTYPSANGLTIQDASGCTIENLTIQNFTGAGVEIDGYGSAPDVLDFIPLADNSPSAQDNNDASGNSVINNTITANTHQGVLIYHASQNTVSGNTITGTTAGDFS